MELSDKQKRVDIVNEIIKQISSRGRNFFLNKKTGFIAHITIEKGRLFFIDDYKQDRIYLHMPAYRRWQNFSHGGTMKGLILDFKHYIVTGEYSNHMNGYGGLYCPHWGYEKEDMEAIQAKARELGYLNDKRP